MVTRIGTKARRKTTVGVGRAGGLWLLVWLLVGACSPGENSLLNPGTNRDGLTSLPETLRVGTAAADRVYRPQVSTGLLSTLRVARTDSVEAIVFLRFSGIPDTSNLTSARLGLRWAGGEGSGLRLAAYRVQSGEAWTETGLTAADTTRLATEPFDVHPDALAPRNDTTLVRRAVEIPGSLLREWVRDADSNLGIALRLTGTSPSGELRFLSGEAVLDVDTTVTNPQIEYLNGDEVLSTVAPDADAFVYVDRRVASPGDGPRNLVAEWLPTRTLVRFAVLDSLTALVGPLAPRLTINRAVLRLHLAAQSGADDTLRVAMHRATTEWGEEAEPDSVVLATTDAIADLPGAIDAESRVLSLEISGLVRAWVEGADNYGLAIRSVTEVTQDHRLEFFSREAADSLRPELEVVFTRPPDPRWGPVTNGGGR